jgi:hypothetical protein
LLGLIPNSIYQQMSCHEAIPKNSLITLQPQVPGDKNHKRVEGLPTPLGQPFARSQPPSSEGIISCWREQLEPAARERLEPNFSAEGATNKKMITGLQFLATKCAGPVTLKAMPLAPC